MLPRDERLALYRSMLKIRRVEERVQALYPEGDMRCPTHFSIGQEAVAAGVCRSLRLEDHVISAHRSHAHYIGKGGNLRAMFAELYGKVDGCASGKGGSMHLIDLSVNFLGCVPIVGSTIPIGVGASFGAMLQDRDAVTAIFFGDAATETGVFHESVNFAAVHHLPVLFVCENNLYSVNTPLDVRQPGTVPLPTWRAATASRAPSTTASSSRPSTPWRPMPSQACVTTAVPRCWNSSPIAGSNIAVPSAICISGIARKRSSTPGPRDVPSACTARRSRMTA